MKMTEQATPKQIETLQKMKLHATPWTLTKQEAWKLLNDAFEKDEKPEAEVVRPGYVPKVEPKAPSKEYHLSVEQVNTNALNAAITMWKDYDSGMEVRAIGDKTNPVIELAKKFKEFIENGS